MTALYLPPIPSEIQAPTSPKLEYFALKYGIHGTLFGLFDRALCEIKQLRFCEIYHHLGYSYSTKEKRDGKSYIIPEEEISEYRHAIMSVGLMEAHNDGANYSLPIGEKRWVLPDEPQYQQLSVLRVLDYVH